MPSALHSRPSLLLLASLLLPRVLALVLVNDALSPLSVDGGDTIVFRWSSPACVVGCTFSLCVIDTGTSKDAWCTSGANASAIAYTGSAVLPSDTDWGVLVNVSQAGSPDTLLQGAFSTGPSPAEWASTPWIGGFTELRSPPFTLPPLSRARLYVSSAGCYDAWVDGVQVSHAASFLNPGLATLSSTRLLYSAWDVADIVQQERQRTTGGGGTPTQNVLALRLGTCKYGLYTEFCAGNETSCLSAVARLSLTSTDGSRLVMTTRGGGVGGWMGNPSPPITYDHLYNGETYDAQLEQAGWAGGAAAFNNVSGWRGVRVVPAPTTHLSGHSMPAVSALPIHGPDGNTTFAVPALYVTPVAASGSPTSAFVFDYGLNHAGTFVLTLPPSFPESVNLTIRMAERLATCSAGAPPDACGVVNTFPCPAPCCPAGGGCSSMLFHYASSGGAARYVPTFATGGFRWLQLEGWPPGVPPPSSSALQAVRFSTTAPRPAPHATRGDGTGGGWVSLGSVSSPQPLLNAIQAAVVTSLASNFVSHPTDCPTRERRGWMGDAQVTVDAHMLNFAPTAAYTNWLRTMADTQDVGCATVLYPNNSCAVFHGVDASSGGEARPPSLGNGPGSRPDCYLCCSAKAGFGCEYDKPTTAGSLPDIVPVNGPSRAWPGSICWTTAVWKVALALVNAQGDGLSVAPLFPAVLSAVKFYNSVANDGTTPDGLLWYEAYGDWEPIEHTSTLFVANAHYILGLENIATVASAVGQPDVAAALLLIAAQARAAVAARYLQANASTGLLSWDTGSQTANALGLALGLSGEPLNSTANAQVAASLVAAVERAGGHLTVGMLGARYVLEALSLIGRDDLALAMANTSTFPGWGWFVTSPSAPAAVGTLWESWEGGTGSTSLNHGMLGGGVGVWVYERALGVRVRQRFVTDGCGRSLREGEWSGGPAAASVLGVTREDLAARFGLSEGQVASLLDVAAAPLSPPGLRKFDPALRVLRAEPPFSAASCDATGGVEWAAPKLEVRVEVSLHPSVIARVGAARGAVPTSAGHVHVSWTACSEEGTAGGGACGDDGTTLARVTVSAPPGVVVYTRQDHVLLDVQ